MTYKPLALSLISLLSVACSGGDGEKFEDVAESMAGIYEINTFTLNSEACEPGGDDQLRSDSPRFMVAMRQSVFGTSLLNMLSCESPDHCRELVAAIEGGAVAAVEFSFSFARLNDEGAISGQFAFSGADDDGTCIDGSLSESTATLQGQSLEVVRVLKASDDYPVDSEGFCTTDAAAEAAAGNECAQMERLTATFVDEL